MRYGILKCVLSVTAITLLGGCGSDTPTTVKVRGSVQFDGQPLDFGGVLLQPTGGRLGKGRIEPDGTFVISTYDTSDGAIVGPVKIGVTAVRLQGDSRDGGTREWLIPERFGSPDTSGLQLELTHGAENVLLIKLAPDGTGRVTRVE